MGVKPSHNIYIWAKLVGNSISNSISWHACNTDSLFPDNFKPKRHMVFCTGPIHDRINSNQAQAWSLTDDKGVILPLKGISLMCQFFCHAVPHSPSDSSSCVHVIIIPRSFI